MPNNPSQAQWQQLYTLADRIKELAPWNDLYEDDLFGVRDPVTGEDYFISVMGASGEHCAIAVYCGALALYQFWTLRELDQEDAEVVIPLLLSIRQLQLAFEDRENLENYDRTVIKQLGRKYRGRAAWPTFRSFMPGYLPWRIDSAEADLLIRILEQAADVLARASTDETLLEPLKEDSYLMRIPETQDGGIIWRDEVVQITPPPFPSLEIQISSEQIEAIRKLDKQREVEVDIVTLPEPVVDDNGRPFLPNLLMVVDSKSGMVYASEMLPTADTPMRITANAVHTLLATFTRLGWTPNTIFVRNNSAEKVLQPIMKKLGVKLKVRNRLLKLDQALEELLNRFGSEWMSMPDLDDDDSRPSVRHRGRR